MTPTKMQDIKAPFFLRDLHAWVIWRLEYPPKATKPRKVPYYANGGRRSGGNGSPEDIKSLVDFETAKVKAEERGFEGVGIAFLPEFGFTGVDFDDCIDENGVIDPEVEAAVLGTYAEVSPSGKGVHAFVTGDLGDKKSHVKDGKYGIELFNTKMYLTFTGKPLEICEISDHTNTVAGPNDALKRIIGARFGAAQPVVPSYLASSVEPVGVSLQQLGKALSVLPNDLDYDQWFKIGAAIHHETEGSEEGFVLWDSWSANSPKYGSEEYGRERWNSMGKNTTIRPYTARELIKLANKLGAGLPDPEGLCDDDFTPILDDTVPEGYKSFFNIRTAEEFADHVKPLSWIIKGFLPRATLGVLYGESGAGKSFITLDICASIARSLEWNGLRCPSPANRVLYVVAEGVQGFSNRITAYCDKAGISKRDLKIDVISDVAPNLMDGVSVDHLIRDIISRDHYDLIVMDTFAQVMPGANENSGEDVGKALGYCRKISQSCDTMVLLVHHSGKDASKGARGWSGIRQTSDVVYEVTRFDENRVLKVVKQKDGLDGMEYGFKLLPVILGTDPDGDPVTSCAVEYGAVERVSKKRVFHKNQKVVADALSTFSEGAWTTVDSLLNLCMESSPVDRDGNPIRRATIHMVIKKGIGDFIEENANGEIRMKGLEV